MLPLTQEALTELAMNFLFYFIIGSFGAFLKDLHETLTKKNEQIRLGEVLIGGACATFICYGLQDTWFKDFSVNSIVLITFVCGILGFELFGNLTTISKFHQLVATIISFKNRFTIAYNEPPPTPPPEVPEIPTLPGTLDKEGSEGGALDVKDDVKQKK